MKGAMVVTWTGVRPGRERMALDYGREVDDYFGKFAADIGISSKGYTTETDGHCTIVVDRAERVLVGAFLAGPAVSEAIHECVLAIRARIPLATLADTIHAFPTVARVLGSAFIAADRDLSQ